jgi:DNA-directed RNA polymerase subunit RPC12/RpoP
MAEMFLLASPKFGTSWVCSNCDTEFKATDEFRLNVVCPNCGEAITYWDDTEG